MLKSVAFASVVGALALGASSAQASTTLSAGLDPECGSAGCFTDSLTYSRTFSADSFAGGVNIAGLTIDKRLLGAMSDYVLKVSFVRADGTVVSSWGGWLLAVLGDDVVSLTGPDFDWGADMGDLTLKLDLVVPGEGGGYAWAWGRGGGLGGSPFNGGAGLGGGAPNFVSNAPPAFLDAPAGPSLSDAVFMVPEPSTWALMLVGFGGMGAMLRRARRLAPLAVKA